MLHLPAFKDLDPNKVPIRRFRQRIAKCTQETVTHSEITRILMAISEASPFVPRASSMGNVGRIQANGAEIPAIWSAHSGKYLPQNYVGLCLKQTEGSNAPSAHGGNTPENPSCVLHATARMLLFRLDKKRIWRWHVKRIA